MYTSRLCLRAVLLYGGNPRSQEPISVNRQPDLMRPRALLFLILVAFVALAGLYSVTTPIFETPDEVWHYAYVRQLALNHDLPVVDAEGKAPYRHEGLQPPLYYTAGAPLIGWLDAHELEQLLPPNPFARIGDPQASTNDNRNAFLHTADENFPYHGTALAVHLLRLYSILLGAGTVLFTYRLAREVFPDQPMVAWGAVLFVAFLPQFLFISGAISNDNLATLLSVATLWHLARTLRRGLTTTRTITLGLLVAAGLLTKLTTIALLGMVCLVIFYVAWQKRDWRAAIVNMALAAGLAALLAGGWYIRNWLLYGDLTTWTRLVVLVGERVQPLSFWRWFTAEGEGLRLSLWGVFGWFNIRASPEFYAFYDALAAFGVAGMVVALATRRSLSLRLAILPLWCGLTFVALWSYASIVVTSQGRLLFPALPAAAILWSWGLFTLIPSRGRSGVVGLLGVSLTAIAVLVPFAFIAPAYKPTLVAENALPQNAVRLNMHFENGIEWLGALVERGPVEPGQTLAITIYERVPAGASGGNALFFHLINSANVILAQRDSLVASGNLALSTELVIVGERFTLSIPMTVPAPDEWRLVAGMYDPASGNRFAATDDAGARLGEAVTLATMAAEPPASGWNFDFDGRGALTGADFKPAISLKDGTFPLTLRWRGVTAREEDYHLFLHILGPDEHIWAAHDTILDPAQMNQFNLRLDPQTPPGEYQVELGIYSVSEGERLAITDERGQPLGDRLMLGPIRVEP